MSDFAPINQKIIRVTVSQGLRWYSKMLCIVVVILIFAGGMVTSTGSGLAVPDWPLSYGSVFPPMVGGIFYEHGHRLIASLVGLLTVVLTVWILRVEQRKWVRRLTLGALVAVILQGVLGGMTVKFLLPPPISIFHGILAQTFLVITVVIAYSQSREHLFHQLEEETQDNVIARKAWVLFGFMYIQLIIAAIMRHTKSGLAIPDFPTMAGSIFPSFSDETLRTINDQLFSANMDLVQRFQVVIHFLHRIQAFAIFAWSVYLGVTVFRAKAVSRRVVSIVGWILLSVGVQVFLGAWTIWSRKTPVITSLHVANGALLLGLVTICVLRSTSWSRGRKSISHGMN